MEVLEDANGAELRHIAHILNLLTILGTHRLGELGARDKGSGDRVTVLHAKMGKDSIDVGSLVQICNSSITIPGDANFKNVMELTKICNVELLPKVPFEVDNVKLIL